MSTAFRNFIITFVLAAALFAVVGYIAVGGILEGIFNTDKEVSTESVDYSYGDVDMYYEDNSEGSGDENIVPSDSENSGEAYLIFYEDQNNELMSSKVIFINRQTGKVVFEELPLSSTLLVNGYNRTIKEVYASNGEAYLCGKLQFVFGVPFNKYMVFTPDAMRKLFVETEVCLDHNIVVSCIVPYEIKYPPNTDAEEYNKEHPDDPWLESILGETDITSDADGKAVLNVAAPYIFDEIPDDEQGSKDAAEMFMSIFKSVSEKVFFNYSLKAETDDIGIFFSSFERCNMKTEDFDVIFSAYGDGALPFDELSSMSGKELSWEKLPEALDSLLGE